MIASAPGYGAASSWRTSPAGFSSGIWRSDEHEHMSRAAMKRWLVFPCRLTLRPGEPAPFEPFEVEARGARIDRIIRTLRRRHRTTVYAAQQEDEE